MIVGHGEYYSKEENMDQKRRARQDAEFDLTDVEDVFTTEEEIPKLVSEFVARRREKLHAEFEDDYCPVLRSKSDQWIQKDAKEPTLTVSN